MRIFAVSSLFFGGQYATRVFAIYLLLTMFAVDSKHLLIKHLNNVPAPAYNVRVYDVSSLVFGGQ